MMDNLPPPRQGPQLAKYPSIPRSLEESDIAVDENDVKSFLDQYLQSETKMTDHIDVTDNESEVSTPVSTPALESMADSEEFGSTDLDGPQEKGKKRKRLSRFRGVSKVNQQFWGAKFSSFRIGLSYRSEEEAAMAYDRFLAENHPDKYLLYCNFCPGCSRFRNPLHLKDIESDCKCVKGHLSKQFVTNLHQASLTSMNSNELSTHSVTTSPPYSTPGSGHDGTVSVSYKSRFLAKYWRNARKNIQCFPYCQEFGDFYEMKMRDLSHKNPGVCKAAVVAAISGPVAFPSEMVVLGRFNYSDPDDNAITLTPEAFNELRQHCFVGETFEGPEAEIDSIYVRFEPEVWKFDEPLKKKKRPRSVAGRTRAFFVFEVLVYMKNYDNYDLLGFCLSPPFEFASTRTALRKKKEVEGIIHGSDDLLPSPMQESGFAAETNDYESSLKKLRVPVTITPDDYASLLDDIDPDDLQFDFGIRTEEQFFAELDCGLQAVKEESIASIAQDYTPLPRELDLAMLLMKGKEKMNTVVSDHEAEEVKPRFQNKASSKPNSNHKIKITDNSSSPLLPATVAVSYGTRQRKHSSGDAYSAEKMQEKIDSFYNVQKSPSDHISTQKSPSTTKFLARYFGWAGAHHFYLGRTRWGISYALSFGLLGFGWYQDVSRTDELTARANIGYDTEHEATFSDLRLICQTPFGIFGAHQYFQGRLGMGLLYSATIGVALIGWISDLLHYRKKLSDNRDDGVVFGGASISLL